LTRNLLPLSLLFLLLLAFPAAAQTCDLAITVTCTDSGECSSVTTNNGSNTCTGEYYIGYFVDADAQLSGFSNTLGLTECFNSGEFPPGTFPQPFAVCFGGSALRPGASFSTSVRLSGARTNVPLIGMTFVIDPITGEERGGAFAFANVDVPTCKPRISSPPLVQSGANYTVTWSTVTDPSAQFIIEESTSPDFTANVVSATVNGQSRTFRHDVSAATTYYYRVRPASCAGGTAEFSEVASTVVQAPPPVVHKSGEAAVPFGSTTPVQFKVFIPGSNARGALEDSTFTATTDKPYLSVSPSSGPLPPEGTTVTVTANPAGLQPGANTGSLKVTANNQTTAIPLSISLVTPVQPGTKTTPPANALVIPVVTHVQGSAGPFLSDVRLTNASPASIKYLISMTPTETDATKFNKTTEVTVESQQTIALNDVVKNFFGYGATSNPADFGFGALEIRPLNTSSTQTYASSRTYASTTAGTFGQFIAAVPFMKFASRGTGLPIPGAPTGDAAVMSLQQIAQSAKFRTNLGLVEGAGQPASGRIRVLDDAGTLLKELPFALQPGEHRQMNRFLETQAGISNLEDGRIEVIVDSDTGAVTAYASVLDNVTTDPLAVMPVAASQISSTRYVIPGIAELPGENNFHSDIRVYNGGERDAQATFTYYPFNGLPPVSGGTRTIAAGQVLAIDNVLREMFNHSGTGGQIVITTTNRSSLVATARTYTNVVNGGTYGQFIPGVTSDEGIGRGDRALEVLQLEESQQFRTNLGLAELTGNPVDLRISVHFPDTKVTASTVVSLAANEFRQYNKILEYFFTNPGDQTFNARVSVEVIAGNGRVTAYGSVIDNVSKDPTYVPAQ
jgi:hypothetical protein